MAFLDFLFKKKKHTPITNTHSHTTEEFSRLSTDDKMRFLIKLGDRKDIDLNDFKYFQFVILSDPDKHVKFTALKRIHVFLKHPETIPMLNRLKETINNDDLEPYFSMALTRVGIMTIEDFQKKINASDI